MKRRGGNRYLGNQTVLTIKHTEYLRDVIPSQNFNLQVEEAVNPGLLSVFPWLGLIGQNFEEYKFHKLCFHFRSHSSDSVLSTQASTALGSVMMAFQYNVLAPPYVNKRDLLNNSTAVSTKPSNSKSLYLDLRHQPIRKLWIRTGTQDPNQISDRRLYDIADFHLATEGCQGSVGAIGELWVTAIVTFTKPTTQFRAVPFDIFTWTYDISNANQGADINLLSFSTVYDPTDVIKSQPPANLGGIIKKFPAYYKTGDATFDASTTNGFVRRYNDPANPPSINDLVTAAQPGYFFPPQICNYPTALFELAVEVIPTGTVTLTLANTGDPATIGCTEVQLLADRGRTIGSGTSSSSGIITQHYLQMDDNILPSPGKLPMVTFGEHLVFTTVAADRTLYFKLTVKLLQMEANLDND